MFRRANERYVVLQDTIPAAEQQAIARAVSDVLPPVRPSPAFVRQLSQDLLVEAQQQQTVRATKDTKILQILGLLSGGIFSLLGGIAIWLLVQRNHEQPRSNLGLSAPRRSTVSAGPA